MLTEEEKLFFQLFEDKLDVIFDDLKKIENEERNPEKLVVNQVVRKIEQPKLDLKSILNNLTPEKVVEYQNLVNKKTQ